MNLLIQRPIAALLLLLPLSAGVLAADADPVTELSQARRIYVPVEDLDVIIERDKQGVLLPRAKFDVLVTQAKANAEKTTAPEGVSVVLTSADYAARIVDDQLLISVTAELTQFDQDWRELRFGLQRLSVEQALLDDAPALVGRHPDGSISLFSEKSGTHTLKLQLSTELTATGSDQVAAFSLLKAPSGTLTLSLPAGKRLLVGNLQLERPAPNDQVADYKIAVGGAGGLQLRITDRAAENAADSLTFASTGYGLHVAPGEVTWHALTTLQVFGKPIDRLTLSVPSQLEIADVEATGLEGWNLSDDPNEAKRTIITLTFGQAFDGSRKIALRGVMAVETSQPWAVPPLRIASVTSHVGQIVIQYPAGIRLRVEESAGVRRATASQKSAADMPDDMPKLEASQSLRFDVWQPDFTLRLTTQPKEREVQSAVAAVLDVNSTGLELQVALSLETHFAPLFEADIRLPSEWQVVSAQRDGQPLRWQLVSLDEPGVNQLRVLLDPALGTGGTAQIRLVLRQDVEGWPVEADPVVINLPELFLPQSSLTESEFVIRGDDDLDLEALDLTGLDPQPLKANYERLRFQSQDTRYKGKLKITRKPSRISVQTVTISRIDPQTFHTFLQAMVEVQGGGVRSIKVSLPESVGTEIRFECQQPRIVEQKPAAPANGQREWTLQFDQRLRGQALLTCDLDQPRGETAEYVVPQWQFAGAERQNGYFAAEAGGEQRLTIVANGADGVPLPEVDPLELPAVYYQPKERIVAVYRTVATGSRLTLSEQRFDKLPIPTAVCPRLEIATIVGRTGELQHRASFQLQVVGVQGLHVTFPVGTTLWATLIDGQPVEVRRNGDVYLVPLTAQGSGNTPGQGSVNGQHLAQFYYQSATAPLAQFGTLEQQPPMVTVESGQRTALPVEVLSQTWQLFYPEETRVIENQSSLEVEGPLDSTSVFGDWQHLTPPRLEDLGPEFAAVLVTGIVIALLGFAARRRRLLAGGLIVFLLLLVTGLLLPALTSPLKRSNVGTPFVSSTSAVTPQSSAKSAKPGVAALASPTMEDISGPKSEVAESKSLPNLKFHSEGDFDESSKESGRRSVAELEGREKSSDGQKQPQRPSAAMGINGTMPAADRDQVMDAELKGVGDRQLGRGGQAMAQQEQPAPKDAFGGEQPPEQSVLVRQSGRLSLAIDFVPPAGSREKKFNYVGANETKGGVPLNLQYVDRKSSQLLQVFVAALTVLIGWFLRRTSTRGRMALATIGLLVPLALRPLLPASWQIVSDGVLMGTAIVVILWLLRAACGKCCGCCVPRERLVPLTPAALLAVLLFTSNAHAQPVDPSASSTAPLPASTLVIPFDAGTEPLASERVFLSQEQFLTLYRLAHPEQAPRQPAPQLGGVMEALYAAKFVPNAKHPEDSVIEVTARYAIRSFVQGQLIVELPVGPVSAKSATLDGQAAALIATAGCLKVAVTKPGLHVLDFVFDVPARISGSTGSFTLPLLPVPVGKLSFELPTKDLSLRVNGSSTAFRQVTQDERRLIELPIDKGGEISLAWQPKQANSAAAAIVHVDSVEAVAVTDAGVAVNVGFHYRVRQGGIADTSFTLPDSLRLQSVSGPDVGGWELQGDGATRKLRVIFRRNVTDQTPLMIETFLDVKVGTQSTVVTVPQVAPQEITNEIGQVAVYAGLQFSLRAEQVESLTQVDGEKFNSPVPVRAPSQQPQLAYRFAKRPFTLNLRVARQESQSHVTAQQAAFISTRKQQVTSRLRFNLIGAPRSSLSVALPPDFVLLDVQATALRDWYITKRENAATLTIELATPRLGETEVVIAGFAPRTNAAATVIFPQPQDASRVESTAAVWLEEGITANLNAFDGWRSVDPSNVQGELRAVRPNQPAQFAFSSNVTAPGPITLSLQQLTPRISANGLSIVTVTDVAVVYTLAFQWQIDAAKTDTLTLTTPDWLAGKLDFQGEGIREATQADAGNGRSRWTISLRTPVSGKYFATATATLPPATTEVQAPAIVFEQNQQPLESQQQFALLINSSLSQLTEVDSSLVEAVQREDLPLVVQQEYVDQATELVRIKILLTAPRWSLRRFAVQPGVPASVNVADLTTVISRDGTYRSQAIYTIKNRSRQFLALQMPDGSELLSVFVNGNASRAVTTTLPTRNGPVQLIALPKSSAASLSFPVTIVWSGRLSGPLPRQARLSAEDFAIPSPHILSQQDDPDFGIPVARTRWSVYIPNEFEAHPVRPGPRYNLSLADANDSPYGHALVQEISDLSSYVEQVVSSNRRTQSLNNLKQLEVGTDNLKQLGKAIEQYSNSSDAEFMRTRADVLKRLSEAEQHANVERQKSNEYFNKALQSNSGVLTNDELSEGMIVAEEQRRALAGANAGSGLWFDQSDKSDFTFQLQTKAAEVDSKSAGDGKPEVADSAKPVNPNNETRQQFRVRNQANLDDLNGIVTNNSVSRGNQSQGMNWANSYQVPQGQMMGMGGGGIQGMVVDGSLWGAQQNINGNAVQFSGQYPGGMGGMAPPSGMGGGVQQPGQTFNPFGGMAGGGFGNEGGAAFARMPQSGIIANAGWDPLVIDNAGIAMQNDLDGRNLAQRGAVGGLGMAAGQGAAPPVWKQTGGLSLPMTLPLSGQNIVFSKVGGDPVLTLAIRPEASLEWAISLVWAVVWVIIAAAILRQLRQPSAVQQLLRRIPVGLVVLGILGYFVVPQPWNYVAFAAFVIGSLVLAFMPRPSTQSM